MMHGQKNIKLGAVPVETSGSDSGHLL